jgi:cytochrome c oxidase subunit II
MNELFRRMLNLPVQGSSIAREVDMLHYVVISVTMVGATLVALLGVSYAIRYRRRTRSTDASPHSTRRAASEGTPIWLEISIIVGLLALFCGFWVAGFRQYVAMRVVPEGALEIYVTAKKWMWTFVHPDGRRDNAVLYVPVGRPVKLIMSSRDVIHSFYVPAFRIKQDVVPGSMTTVWFEAVEPGTYWIFCTEYCGTGHSTMRGQVVALSESDYERHLTGAHRPEARSPGVESLASVGRRVAAEAGCLRCHTLDGTPHIGPSFAETFGATITLDDGSRLVVDEAYLTESMMDPMARIRAGYGAVMPSYRGLVSAPETAALVELIKSLREVPPEPFDPPPEGPLELPEGP